MGSVEINGTLALCVEIWGRDGQRLFKKVYHKLLLISCLSSTVYFCFGTLITEADYDITWSSWSAQCQDDKPFRNQNTQNGGYTYVNVLIKFYLPTLLIINKLLNVPQSKQIHACDIFLIWITKKIITRYRGREFEAFYSSRRNKKN